MSSIQEFDEAQLAAARAKAWHQDGDALVTLEATRDWVNACGIVLFAPRSGQLPVPAPSLVEATLGAANAGPTMAETQVARSLVARLVGEGLALPLNLLGVPGDSPDFVVSAQVFSYIFTMRGDKAWKTAPATSGAVKVSPLGLRVYEVLTERGPMSAAELAMELGREVTEAAILRSLSELWSQLRVLPLLSQGDAPTLWELTSRRFTKSIKAGANAGLPKALSAVVSLYLAQVFAATEDEITTFVSPLTARSRVREVLHALVGARQLETVVLEGKTLLHIPGGLPASVGGVAAEQGEGDEAAAVVERPKKVGTGRITKFADSPERKTAGEFRGKPVAKPGARPPARSGSRAAARPAFGSKPAAKFGPRLDGKTDSERRPFKKDAKAGGKPSFTKPWDEGKKARPAAAGPDAFTKYRKPEPEDRAPLGPREQAGLPIEKRSKPKSSFDYASKSSGAAKRPYAPRGEGAERPTFKPRSYEKPGGAKPRSFDEKGSGFGGKKPFVLRSAENAGRPVSKTPYAPRTGSGGEKSFAKRPYMPRTSEGGERPYPKKPFAVRASGGEGEKTFAKRPYTPRTGSDGERPAGKPFAARTSEGSFPKRAYTPRPSGGGGRSFTKRTSFTPQVDDSSERTFAKRPYKPRAADADSRPFTKAPWTPPAEERSSPPKRAFKPRGEGGFRGGGAGGARKNFGGKPGGTFGGAKRSGPSGGGFAGRKKPTPGE